MKRTALITGASSGIGAAFACHLAGEDYSLILHGRREDKLKAVLESLPGSGHRIILGDLSDGKTIDGLIAAGREAGLSLLINNAGYGAGRDFLSDELDNQMGMLQVHCTAVALLCRGLIPGMIERGGGEVINVSSIAGEQSLPNSVMYSATKSFLTTFTESLALELSGSGVRIQALLPGFTHTDFHDRLPEWEREKRSKGIVRWQPASDVAAFSLKQLRKKKPRIIVIPGFYNKILAAIPHLLPRRMYQRIAVAITR